MSDILKMPGSEHKWSLHFQAWLEHKTNKDRFSHIDMAMFNATLFALKGREEDCELLYRCLMKEKIARGL